MLKRQGRCVAVYAVTAAAVGFLFGFNAGPAAPGPSSSALRAVAAESTIPDGWDADAALTSTGFKCSAGRGRPWAIVHDADYDLRTLRVTEKWLPNHKRVLPVLLSRGWSVVRVGMPGIAAGHHVASALDDACSGARERCLALDCDLLARLPFTQPTCGASCAAQPSASLSAARNAAALLAVACGASHVLEASSSMLSSGTLSDAELLDPTAAAWAAGAPSWRARMAGAGNVKVMAADEPASGGFVHVLAHLGEPILFSRGLPGARIPNVTMSVMDLRAPMGEQAPFVPIHVFVPDGTPDASAAARAARQGYFPRKPQQDYSTRRDKHWLFPGSVTPYGQETLVRTLNPGSVAPYGALATLYSREALWALFLRPGSCRAAEGIWGAEALRSLVTEAILHMAGSTVAWVGGRQGFYRPVAPVTDLEILAEAAADLTIERVAAALVTAVRAALLEGPRFEARSLPAAFDYVLGVLERAKVLPAEATGGLRRWATDLKRLGYELDGMFARAGTAGAGAPFLTPMTVCSAEPNRTEPPTHRVRAAMCINGEAQYYDSAIASIHTLRPYFPDDNLHVFVYAATFVMPHDEMLKILSINSTRTVLYGDRITFGRHAEHPEIPRMWNSTDIFAEQFPEAFRNHHGMDYQQQWGNNVCYEAVRAFAHVHGIEYELMIRQRSDHFTIVEDPSAFAPPLRPGYAKDYLVVPNDQHYMGVNDRWGIGGFKIMWHHMGRYCKLSRETVWNPWGEPYLKCSFNESGIPIVFEDALRTRHGGGFDDQLRHCGVLVPDLPALTRSG